MEKFARVGKILRENSKKAAEYYNWPWLGDNHGHKVDKKSANKFMLGVCIDYNIKADDAWENARILSEIIMDDPDDLWTAIIDMGLSTLQEEFSGICRHPLKCNRCSEGHPFAKTSTGEAKRHHTLHRFKNQAAQRVWKTAQVIADHYGGDARKIWIDQTDNAEILDRLDKAKIGPQLAHMTVMALLETKQIKGSGRLKADLNVNRVLGRVFTGDKVSPDEAHRIADEMEQGNTWIFDKALFELGQYICTARNPYCEGCILREECKYYDYRN